MIGKNVLVMLLQPDTGGIITDEKVRNVKHGIVVSAGKDCKEVKEDDFIFLTAVNRIFKDDGFEYTFVHEDDIPAVLEAYEIKLWYPDEAEKLRITQTRS